QRRAPADYPGDDLYDRRIPNADLRRDDRRALIAEPKRRSDCPVEPSRVGRGAWPRFIAPWLSECTLGRAAAQSHDRPADQRGQSGAFYKRPVLPGYAGNLSAIGRPSHAGPRANCAARVSAGGAAVVGLLEVTQDRVHFRTR